MNKNPSFMRTGPCSLSNKAGFVAAFALGVIVNSNFGVQDTQVLEKRSVTQHIRGIEGTATAMDCPVASVKGKGFEIFCPHLDINVSTSPQLLSPPETWIERFEGRLSWLDTFVHNDDRPVKDRSIDTYIEFLQQYVTGLSYGREEMTVSPQLTESLRQTTPLDVILRAKGNDWTYLGDTMTGNARLDNVRDLLHVVVKNDVPGDYIETGVWRGGSSIYARGVIRALGQKHRKSFVCDSFKGLPPGERLFAQGDKGWDNTPYLEVSAELVAGNFNSAGLLDENVIFAKGFFNDSMPVLAKSIESFAIIRFDGDMYESAVDVFYHMYDKLSVGGYWIQDDWYGFPSKTAAEDFFKVHGISPEVIRIDDLSAYWKKTENITVQNWRYEQNKFVDE